MVADHYGTVTGAVRAGLSVADALHGAVGTRAMEGSLAALRRLSGGRVPKWSSAVPRPARFAPVRSSSAAKSRVVYFPSCAARTMGAQHGDEDSDALPSTVTRVLRKAGFEAVFPKQLSELCCGQPFESKGFFDIADRKSAELEAALAAARGASDLPVLFDTSPCAYRMRRFLAGRLPVSDGIEFLHDQILSRVTIERRDETIAVHAACSVRKMGTVEKLTAIAARCSRNVVAPDDVLCCGFAGDKGFSRPELNDHALRHLKQALPRDCSGGYSSSRTCEIGLSEHAAIPYRSIFQLVDACARPLLEEGGP
jgi:D-lactate dehydrogenase